MSTVALPPPTWTTGHTDAIKTGTWRAALPAYGGTTSPCRLACPVSGEIARWIGQARNGDWHGAWRTLVEHNPLPAVAGFVCHHPCESACHRGGYDEALAVRALEREAGARALEKGWRFPAPPPADQGRVAVVGGGPAGLSAACQLRRRGHAVTLYEAKGELGGLLRDGIPPYRLPRQVLDGEIARILDLGIEVRTGCAFTARSQYEDISDAYDAVFLAIGARAQKRLPQLDYARPWVMDGAEYLAQSNAGRAPALGRRVAVIGGGSAAMDAARSARRAGHEVAVLCLESEAQMPAQREEVLAAQAEGVALFPGAMLRRCVPVDGSLKLECVFASFDPRTMTATPRIGGNFSCETDAVVTAIGADPQLPQGVTDRANVLAGGDAVSTQRFVTHAIGMGERAALEIHRRLSGEPAPAATQPRAVARAQINTFYHPTAKRAEDPLAEAARCFSCGECTLCDNCFDSCPDMAVRRVADGYAIAGDYCKGCGLCVAECPTGSIAMYEEVR